MSQLFGGTANARRTVRRTTGWLLSLVLAALMAFVVAAPAASADDKVANPGQVEISLVGGTLAIGDGSLLPHIDISDIGTGDDAPTLTGTVDADGNVTIPKENIVFPDLPIQEVLENTPPIQSANLDLLVAIVANTDGTGTIDPTTGAATLNVDLRIELRGVITAYLTSSPTVARVVTLNNDGRCQIPSIPLQLSTEGENGQPYNVANGQARVQDDAFPVSKFPTNVAEGAPAPNPCGVLLVVNVASFLNTELGLPMVAGASNAELQVKFSPKPVYPGYVPTSYDLTVNKTGDGSGTVTADPAGPDYELDEEVTLTAEPAGDSTFAGWTGCDEVTEEDECVVTMTDDRTVSARFDLTNPIVKHTLTVNKTGTGSGNVSSSPSGTSFDEGTQVTLTATPSAGSLFDGWTGCDSEPAGKCVVTMGADRTVEAKFVPEPGPTSHTLTINKTGQGSGKVQTSPSGTVFDTGTQVTLVPSPAPDATFAGWTGCDTEVDGTCVVTMNADKTVGASFSPVADAFKAGDLKLTLSGGWIKVLAGILPPVEAADPGSDPITLTAKVGKSGQFTSADFNFPARQIPMDGDDPLIASIIGDHIDLNITASSSFAGSFSSTTGGLETSIPLNLSLGFNGDNPFSCILPLTINFDTNGKLIFPAGTSGGQPTVYPASRFAPPAPRNGAVYGQWDAVQFNDVEDGPGTEAGVCGGVLSLLPAVVPDWPAGLTGIEGELWLSGAAEFEETKDVVIPPVPDKANLAALKIKPKSRAVKRGKKAVVSVSVKNNGKGNATGAKVCVTAPKKLVKVKKCVNLGQIAAGKTKTAKFKVTVKKNARKGKKAVLRFKATAKDVKAKTGKATIKVR